MSMIGDYRSMAEVDGYWPESYDFVPGVDFDPNDEDEVAAVMLVGERDVASRMKRLESENARLREELEEIHARSAEVD